MQVEEELSTGYHIVKHTFEYDVILISVYKATCHENPDSNPHHHENIRSPVLICVQLCNASH
jgi:hypothetical protein